MNFDAGIDNQGRKKAVNVLPLVELRPSLHVFKAFFVGSASLLLIGYLHIFGFIPLVLVWLYLGASVVAFILYAVDKSSARNGKRRIPEATLHNVALMGGWPGALFAQQILRHKSKKQSFRDVFWVTVMLNVGALIYLLSPYGEWLLHEISKLA